MSADEVTWHLQHQPIWKILGYESYEDMQDDNEYKHLEHLDAGGCAGCPQPAEGPHKFGCVLHGKRQIVLNVKGV